MNCSLFSPINVYNFREKKSSFFLKNHFRKMLAAPEWSFEKKREDNEISRV
jgi:hypothetical protein